MGDQARRGRSTDQGRMVGPSHWDQRAWMGSRTSAGKRTCCGRKPRGIDSPLGSVAARLPNRRAPSSARSRASQALSSGILTWMPGATWPAAQGRSAGVVARGRSDQTRTKSGTWCRGARVDVWLHWEREQLGQRDGGSVVRIWTRVCVNEKRCGRVRERQSSTRDS